VWEFDTPATGQRFTVTISEVQPPCDDDEPVAAPSYQPWASDEWVTPDGP
jgi:hypothetical protein